MTRKLIKLFFQVCPHWPNEQALAFIRDICTERLALRSKLTRMMIGGKP